MEDYFKNMLLVGSVMAVVMAGLMYVAAAAMMAEDISEGKPYTNDNEVRTAVLIASVLTLLATPVLLTWP